MTLAIDSITRSTLALAIDATSLRQQALSANIAHADTQGFAALDVDFEGRLDAARAQLARGEPLAAASIAGLQPRIVARPSEAHADGATAAGLEGGIRLDAEAAELAANAVRAQVLLKALARDYALLGLAVADGRR